MIRIIPDKNVTINGNGKRLYVTFLFFNIANGRHLDHYLALQRWSTMQRALSEIPIQSHLKHFRVVCGWKYRQFRHLQCCLDK